MVSTSTQKFWRHGLPLFSQVELVVLKDPKVIQSFSDWMAKPNRCEAPVLGNLMIAATILQQNQGTARPEAMFKISPSRRQIYYLDEQFGVKKMDTTMIITTIS